MARFKQGKGAARGEHDVLVSVCLCDKTPRQKPQGKAGFSDAHNARS